MNRTKFKIDEVQISDGKKIWVTLDVRLGHELVEDLPHFIATIKLHQDPGVDQIPIEAANRLYSEIERRLEFVRRRGCEGLREVELPQQKGGIWPPMTILSSNLVSKGFRVD